MYIITLNELKAVLRVIAHAGQSGVNKTSVESMAEDNFREVKSRKRCSSDITSETAKKSTILVPKSTAVQLPTKAIIPRSELITGRLLEQRTHYRSRRPAENRVGRHQ
jgi:hypothetical protein